MKCTILFISCLILSVSCKKGFGPTDQDWGFVTVREKAHIFWWLHYTTATITNIKEKPLILWLQGGPGSSSTGFGNFAEVGPLDTKLNPRTSAWTQYAHVLFVDSPVGTGFSYVEDVSLLVKNNTQIANDFLVFLKEFFVKFADFETVPFYIFTESYGGKMTAEIASTIIKNVKEGNLKCNLKGIALGDSWISPADTVTSYAPFLLSLGIIDYQSYIKIDKIAQQLPPLVEAGKYAEGFGIWRGVEYEIRTHTYGVDMYHVLTKKKSSPSVPDPTGYPGETGVPSDAESRILSIMNNEVRNALKLERPWGTQNEMVFDVLTGPAGDFMAPAVDIVESLLNETDIKITVYTADFDLICNTLGTVKWVNNMNWDGKDKWEKAPRNSFIQDGFAQGYVKKTDKFGMYWVDRAGHMVPEDNPSAMFYILKEVTNNFEV